MQITDPAAKSKSNARHAVLAGFFGWTLDAFDFFVVVFLYDTLAHQFGVSKKDIIFTTSATLAMRPVGAVIFGLLSDRYGRRKPLMANVIYFSLIELLCGFSPNYTFFLVMRALFGIGMGGEWGVGASLTMEAAPVRWRGILSGILQSGYSIGYLLAAMAARFLAARMGMAPDVLDWRIARAARALHPHKGSGVGSLEAKSRRQHGPSPAHRGAGMEALPLPGRAYDLHDVHVARHAGFVSGLPEGGPSPLGAVVANIAIIYNIGAVIGAIIFGHLSQVAGRRKSMIAALGLVSRDHSSVGVWRQLCRSRHRLRS